MSVQKPKTKKKKDKKKEEKEEETLTVEEQNLFLLRQVESLKHELIKQTSKCAGSEAIIRELRQRLLDLQHDYETQKKREFDLASDMTRQYKSMREQLLQKINSLEDTILDIRKHLEAAKLAKEESERNAYAKLASKEKEMIEQKNKMDDMAHEFGRMLKETLDKMSEKIEITNEWEADNAKDEPIVRTFEDFNLASTTTINHHTHHLHHTTHHH